MAVLMINWSKSLVCLVQRFLKLHIYSQMFQRFFFTSLKTDGETVAEEVHEIHSVLTITAVVPRRLLLHSVAIKSSCLTALFTARHFL